MRLLARRVLVFAIILVSGSVFAGASNHVAHDTAADVTPVSGGETKTTKTGHTFTRIRAEELKKLGVTDTRNFGEAWAEPDSKDGKKGLVWGDIARDELRNVRTMPHRDVVRNGKTIPGAESYCKSIGAELPSGWREGQNARNGNRDSDFVRLAKLMGNTNVRGEGYTPPDWFPNLTYVQRGQTQSRYFWSASVHPATPFHAYYFDGRYGYIDNDTRYYLNESSVRCVVRR